MIPLQEVVTYVCVKIGEGREREGTLSAWAVFFSARVRYTVIACTMALDWSEVTVDERVDTREEFWLRIFPCC